MIVFCLQLEFKATCTFFIISCKSARFYEKMDISNVSFIHRHRHEMSWLPKYCGVCRSVIYFFGWNIPWFLICHFVILSMDVKIFHHFFNVQVNSFIPLVSNDHMTLKILIANWFLSKDTLVFACFGFWKKSNLL